MDIAKRNAAMSKDPSTRVGAVLFDPAIKSIVATGYNGFPAGKPDYQSDYEDRETKYRWVIHAEMNALQAAGRNGIPTEGLTLFCTHAPCEHCMKHIINAGIDRVVYDVGVKNEGMVNEKALRAVLKMACATGVSLFDYNNGMTTYD